MTQIDVSFVELRVKTSLFWISINDEFAGQERFTDFELETTNSDFSNVANFRLSRVSFNDVTVDDELNFIPEIGVVFSCTHFAFRYFFSDDNVSTFDDDASHDASHNVDEASHDETSICVDFIKRK